MPFGDTSKFTLEICCSSIESVLLAQEHGADRVELCQNLEQGGITPSYGLIKVAVQLAIIPVHVLIRPRAGNFVYSTQENEIMLRDIEMCRELGCAGVVIGSAKLESSNLTVLRSMVKSAGEMQVTYQRHFDETGDLVTSLEKIIELGCCRLLTSGGADTAEAGIEQIQMLVEKAVDRIDIMAGAGITAHNLESIIRATGVRHVHASCKKLKQKTGHQSLFDADEIVVDTMALDMIVQKLQRIEIE